MKTYRRHLILVWLILCMNSFLRGQVYTLDQSFYLDLQINGYGIVNGVLENNGNIWVYGGYTTLSQGANVLSFKPDGTRDLSFYYSSSPFMKVEFLRKISDNHFVANLGGLLPYVIDSLGGEGSSMAQLFKANTLNNNAGPYFHNNLILLDAAHSNYIYPDGKVIGTLQGNRYYYDSDSAYVADSSLAMSIWRFSPEGIFDSTIFKIKINKGMPYNTANLAGVTSFNDRDLYLFGEMENYNGYPVNNLIKLDTNGVIDTTFISCISSGAAKPILEQDDGKILVVGRFKIEGLPQSDFYTLVRLNRDGSLDHSFLRVKSLHFFDYVSTVCPTDDGGYLVGGMFNKYQNVDRVSIAKIDRNGILDINAFNSVGFDTLTPNLGIPCKVASIQRSKDMQYYYVTGNFNKYNNQPVKQVVRFYSETFSLPKWEQNKFGIYPNPVSNILNITTFTNDNYLLYSITDITGKVIKESKLNGGQIHVGELINGVYFLSIHSENGMTETVKFIKN